MVTREQELVQAVQEIYAAFGRGDLPAIMGRLGEEIVWDVTGPPEVSYAGARKGRQAVAEFFQVLAQTVEIQRFEPQEFFAQGDTVVVLGRETMKARATQAVAENAWVMVFTFRENRLIRFREFDDTAAVAAAFRRAPAA